MKASVIISTSNFAAFVEESVRSVLDQSRQADEILVVDDGSTDGTLEKLRNLAACDSRIRIFCQDRRGHLAALNKGMAEATGDILFLLDGDDTYHVDHLLSCLRVFGENPSVDLVCTAYRVFGRLEETVSRHRQSGHLGASAIAAMVSRYWPVGPTSCLSFRASLGHKIFPYPPHWTDHHVQTGEAGLVLGASILGAREYFIASHTVNYRAHGSNFDLGRRKSAETTYRILRLSYEIIEHFKEKSGLPSDFLQQALAEFKTWNSPGKVELDCYTRIILQSRHSFVKKIELVCRALRHYRSKL